MIIGLDWQDYGYTSISNPQYLAYNDGNNAISIPDIQFIAKAENVRDEWYPVVVGFNEEKGVVFTKTFRVVADWRIAHHYAKRQVELALQGEYEDGKISHFQLNAWCYDMARNLKLVLDKT